MHLKRSDTGIVSSNAPRVFERDYSSLNNEARVRVLYNSSKRQVSAGPDPKLVARPILVSFLHTSNGKLGQNPPHTRRCHGVHPYELRRGSCAGAPAEVGFYVDCLKFTSPFGPREL